MSNKHFFEFNTDSNGGESVTLSTEITRDGDLQQELSLTSYYNSASFNLCNILTPENLRKLANELESFLNIRSFNS